MILSSKKILLFLYSLLLFFNSSFCLTWSNFGNGRLSVLATISPVLCTVFMLLYLYSSYPNRELNKFDFRVVCGLVLFVVWVLFVSVQKKISVYYLLVSINVVLLLLTDKEERKQIIGYITRIFVICSLPSILYYVLGILNITVPYSILPSLDVGKTNMGIFYQHYPLGLVITGYQMPRPCGLFDEPGYMGTLAAVLYAAIMENKNKPIMKWKISLVIIGIFSFSLAFYILFFARLFIYIAEKNYRKALLLIPLILVGYLLFININFQNVQLQRFQARLMITENGLAGDNRTSTAFDSEYESFLDDDPTIVLRGNGVDAHMQNVKMVGSSSYKVLIYNHGIIGTSLLLLLLLLIASSSGFSKSNLAFLLIYIASMYQRPGVFSVLYMGIFICGLQKNSVHQGFMMTCKSFFIETTSEKRNIVVLSENADAL